MASRRDYVIGTDDVGSIAVADIEEGTALHAFAEAPPEDPDVASDLLFNLEPAQVLALCESSPFYQEICDSNSFKARYRLKWHILVTLVRRFPTLQGSELETYFLLDTRTVGDVKELFVRDTGLARTDYTLVMSPPQRAADMTTIQPTAQSLLKAMTHPQRVEGNIRLLGLVVQPTHHVSSISLTHYLENGETIELSE